MITIKTEEVQEEKKNKGTEEIYGSLPLIFVWRAGLLLSFAKGIFHLGKEWCQQLGASLILRPIGKGSLLVTFFDFHPEIRARFFFWQMKKKKKKKKKHKLSKNKRKEIIKHKTKKSPRK